MKDQGGDGAGGAKPVGLQALKAALRQAELQAALKEEAERVHGHEVQEQEEMRRQRHLTMLKRQSKLSFADDKARVRDQLLARHGGVNGTELAADAVIFLDSRRPSGRDARPGPLRSIGSKADRLPVGPADRSTSLSPLPNPTKGHMCP